MESRNAPGWCYNVSPMKHFLQTTLGILLFVALIVFGLTGLNALLTRPSVVLEGPGCAPPCWKDIVPGMGDPYAVFEIVNSLDGVNKGSITTEADREDRISQITWYFERPYKDSAGTITFEEEQVAAISILTINSLDLADYFEKFGEPDRYWAEIGHREFNDYLRVYLFYPEVGCVVDVIMDFDAGDTRVRLKESTPVFRVTYFDPAQFDDLLETRILIEQALNARKGSFLPWTGYGEIPINN